MKKITVADYLSRQIAMCDMSQKEMAARLGYSNPNIISMFKSGDTRLPQDKVDLMAECLKVDPGYLLRLTMEEYTPRLWSVIRKNLGTNFPISEWERQIILLLRDRFGENNVDLTNPTVVKKFDDLVTEIAKMQNEQEEAAVRTYNASSANARARTAKA